MLLKKVFNFLKLIFVNKPLISLSISIIMLYFILKSIFYFDCDALMNSRSGGFLSPATPVMEAIIDFHHDVQFFLIVITVFVAWLLIRIINVNPIRTFLVFKKYLQENGKTELSTAYKLHEIKDEEITTSSDQIDLVVNSRIRKKNYHQFLEIVWTIIPTIILILIATPSLALLYSMNELLNPELTLKIIGNQWYWRYEYSDHTIIALEKYDGSKRTFEASNISKDNINNSEKPDFLQKQSEGRDPFGKTNKLIASIICSPDSCPCKKSIRSPMEQFELLNIFNCMFSSYFIINNVIILLGVIMLLKYLFFFITIKYFTQVLDKNNLFIFLQNFLKFISNIIRENINIAYYLYNFTVFLTFLFSIIFVLNMVSLIPYNFAVTSHITFTFTLALIASTLINKIALERHSWFFLGFFIPKNSPLVIAPFLVIIELISYIARVFSLAIRLFANIMSGHILSKILASFAKLLKYAVFILIMLLSCIYISEMVIAGLQAYVFLILVCIYFHDAIFLHQINLKWV